MKSASAGLASHIVQTTTTLARGWRIVRVDGVRRYFTTHDKSLTIDVGLDDGPVVYTPKNSYQARAMQSNASLDVDNTNVQAIFDTDSIDPEEVKRGLYDWAEIWTFLVNWSDTSQGIIKMRRGNLGEISALLKNRVMDAELRGFTQALRQKSIVEAYTKDCPADLGDHRCKVPILPNPVQRSTAYAVNDYVRASNTSPLGLIPITTISNPGFESLLASWTTNSGTPVTVTSKSGTTPVEGARFLTGTDGAGSWEIEQVVDLTVDLDTAKIDSGDYLFMIDIRVALALGAGEPADHHQITCTFLDAVNASTGTAFAAGPQAMGGDNGAAFGHAETLHVLVPPLTRKVRIVLAGIDVSDSRMSTAYDLVSLYALDLTNIHVVEAHARAVNPRGELGGQGTSNSPTGWTVVSGNWQGWPLTQGSEAPFYTDGKIVFRVTSGSGSISNTYALDDVFSGADIDSGVIRLGFGVAAMTEITSSRTRRILLEWLDAAGATISTAFDTGTIGFSAADTWEETTGNLSVPVGARKIKLTLTCTSATNVIAFDVDFMTLQHTERTLLSKEYADRIYRCTVAGTTAIAQPTYDTDVGDPTVDGTATFVAEEAWSRAIEVVAVSGTKPRKTFTVTELTPNAGGMTAGRDYFPDDSMNGGVVTFETGRNAGVSRETKDFVADDGVTIEQDLTMHLAFPFDIEVGDKGRVYRGCDKTRATCRDVFANVINFRGFPDVPGQDFMATFPDANL